MDKLALVAAGGALGSVLRYLVSAYAVRLLGSGWPAGTLMVNVAGSAAIGWLAGWLLQRDGGEAWRLLLGVGLLGGFTTFSAFSLEAVELIQRRAWGGAALYVAGSVGLSLAALVLGLLAARKTFP